MSVCAHACVSENNLRESVLSLHRGKCLTPASQQVMTLELMKWVVYGCALVRCEEDFLCCVLFLSPLFDIWGLSGTVFYRCWGILYSL